MKFLNKLTLLLLSLTLCQTLYAQSNVIVIDKVIARVNDHIVLKSDLEKAYLEFLESGQSPPPNLMCFLFEQLVTNKMMIAKAEIDSITVEKSTIDAQLDRRMQYFIGRFGSPEAIEKNFGKTLTQLKEELRPIIQEQMLIQKMRGEITKDVKVTPRQVKKMFAEIPPDSLPTLPSEIEVGQIVRLPKVSQSEKEKAKAKLLEYKQMVMTGKATFEELARANSEDLGSAANGGLLGFQGRGQLVAPFEAAAYSLKPNEISDPVESEFGYHLIQLIERQGNRYNSRHILLRPKPTQDDIARNKQFLDSIRTRIVQDSITFEKAAFEFSDDKNTKVKGGKFHDQETGSTLIPKDRTDLIDYGVFSLVETLTVGEISKPIDYRTEDGKDAARILYLAKQIEAHQMNLKDDWQKLTQLAEEQEKAKIVNEWFEKNKKFLLIDIDSEYNYCNSF